MNRKLILIHRYSEAIGILYSENIFNFNSLQTIEDLQATIPPHRFSSIRSLHLDTIITSPTSPMYAKTGFNKWEMALVVIGMIRGLQAFHIRLSMAALPHATDETLIEALKCLMPFRTPTFIVCFCWHVNKDQLVGNLGGTVLFQIVEQASD